MFILHTAAASFTLCVTELLAMKGKLLMEALLTQWWGGLGETIASMYNCTFCVVLCTPFLTLFLLLEM